jgi:hypothetical protein
MDKKVKLSSTITLVLGCLSLSWIVYDLVAFEVIRPLTVAFHELGPREETLGAFVWLGYLALLVFHISAIVTILFQLQSHKKSTALKGIALFFCILSLFALMGDYSLLNDIGKESKIGMEVEGEWFVLYLVTIFHGLAHLVVFFALFKSWRDFKQKENSELIFKEEVLFITAQFIGIACGAVGLWTNFSFLSREIQPVHYGDILPFYILCFLPYGMIAFIWLLKRFRDKPADWYDEKQWQDIARAALLTLVLSIPGMALLFFTSHPMGIFWFTHYIFLVLFLFSCCTLYFSLDIGRKIRRE